MNKNIDNFYNNFSFFYPLVDIFLIPQKKRLFTEINSCRSGDLLEIGVGNGAHLHLYKTHNVTGIDSSSKMLKTAQKHQKNNIQLLEMNGEDLVFKDQSFDYVVLCHVIAVVDNPNKLLAEAYRVLKPEGKLFILNHFTPKNRLRHVDNFFQPIATLFRFKSVFYINQLSSIKKYEIVKEVSFGSLSYFKLLIYKKK